MGAGRVPIQAGLGEPGLGGRSQLPEVTILVCCLC